MYYTHNNSGGVPWIRFNVFSSDGKLYDSFIVPRKDKQLRDAQRESPRARVILFSTVDPEKYEAPPDPTGIAF